LSDPVNERGEIPAELADNAADLAIAPGDINPPAQLKERDLNRVLSILDDLAAKGGAA